MISFRELTQKDSKAASQFHKDIILKEFSVIPEKGQDFHIGNWSKEKFSERILSLKWTIFGAFDEAGVLVGYVIGLPLDGGVGTINWLGVKHAMQRQDIGKTLLGLACRRFKERGCHKVRVHTETKAGKEFYNSVGFKVEGFHPNQWWGVDYYSFGLFL